MWDFIARTLRALTPSNSVDWLGQHPNARTLKRIPVAGGFQVTYCDRGGESATYTTDPLGNVLHVDVSAQ